MSEPDPQEILKVFSELSPKTLSIIVRWFQSNPSRDPMAPPAPGVSPEEHAAALAEFMSRALAPAAPSAKKLKTKTKKTPRAKSTAKVDIAQLRIDLESIRPPIWRRVTVPMNIKLSDLHEVIQVVMGWTGSHLHCFTIDEISYATPSPFGEIDELEMENAAKHRLNEFVNAAGRKFKYTYDFGDGWEHTIKVEKVLPAGSEEPYRLLDGKRACPPEDCGGPWGYPELLAALADPKHPEHAEMKEWVGEDFDPERFDLEATERNLRNTFKNSK